jgi:hypothetical protein
LNGLHVFATAERSQIQQHASPQLHIIVPLLQALTTQEQPFEFLFPHKDPISTSSEGMDGFIEEGKDECCTNAR